MTVLRIDQFAGTGVNEFWTDISWLCTNGKDDGAFDFDWIFRPDSEDASRPLEAVLPRNLATLLEAQVRVISISPPMPVVS